MHNIPSKLFPSTSKLARDVPKVIIRFMMDETRFRSLGVIIYGGKERRSPAVPQFIGDAVWNTARVSRNEVPLEAQLFYFEK